MQFGRQYELIIGDRNTRDAVYIYQHQVSFDASKSATNKKKGNSASIEVTNLDRDTLKKLEKEFQTVSFSVGYGEDGLVNLLIGEIKEVRSKQQGTDTVTQLILGEGYLALNDTVLSTVVPEGRLVKDVLEEIRQAMPNVDRGVYVGTNVNTPVLYGYPLSGLTRNALEQLADTYRLDYRIDSNVLTVTDERGIETPTMDTAVELSYYTGLIGEPQYSADPMKPKKDQKRRDGVTFQALLNPRIRPGKVIRISSETINGYYRVDSCRYSGSFRGGNWMVEGFATIILEEDIPTE